MNVVTRRAARRAGTGAVALIAAGAMVGLASPAYANDAADLAVDIAGTTIAADASGKFGLVKLTNNGPGTASGVEVAFDISALEQDKVELSLPDICDHTATVITCLLNDEFSPKPGTTTELDIPLQRKAGATGPAGKLTVSVKHAGTDGTPGNDSKTVDVTVGGSGVDLQVIALDVYAVDGDGGITDKPVAPGGETLLWVYAVNQGDTAVQGLKFSLKLPEHVTFTLVEEDCTHAAGDSTTECSYDIEFVPADADTTDGDDIHSDGWFFWPVKVAEGAPNPANLSGGVATLNGVAEVPALAANSARTMLKNFTEEGPSPEFKDVDPSDNSDDFVVVVAKPAPGGSLPITGVKAGLIGGAGAAVLLTGGVLFFLARRRRVVLVTPND